ncbi:MAG TPA: hypothetical protein VGI81_18590 [Tepidisphaeraceae bacterium]|jgi:hypothetical protein
MKRVAVVLALGLAAGCSSQNNGGGPSKSAGETSTPSMQHISHAGETPGYYEYNRDGKTYVTGYASTASTVREGNLSASNWVEKPNFGADGQTVVFEDDGKGLAQKLEKEYQAEHKK